MPEPVHPGFVLNDILTRRNITGSALAQAAGVPQSTVSRILNQKRAISTDVALRFGRVLPERTAEDWLELQMRHDIAVREDELSEELEKLSDDIAPLPLKRGPIVFVLD